MITLLDYSSLCPCQTIVFTVSRDVRVLSLLDNQQHKNGYQIGVFSTFCQSNNLLNKYTVPGFVALLGRSLVRARVISPYNMPIVTLTRSVGL